MPLFQFKHKISGNVIHEVEAHSLKIGLEISVKAGINLSNTYLEEADLRGANLEEADLRGANLRGANLQGANLEEADLEEADLREAYIQGTYLRGADLRGAYLRGADLRGANLRGADLRGANLEDKNNPIKTIKQFGNLGSTGWPTTCFICEKSIEINRGCWWGNLDEFEKKLHEEAESMIAEDVKEYRAWIEFLKEVWG